jgi:NAD(P)H-hydrate epimerase
MHLTSEQARELDRKAIEEFGVPSIVLMENAGRAMAQLLLDMKADGPVAICCGAGNNGGDGFVIARHLDNARIPVRALLFADPDKISRDSAINHRIARASGIPIDVIGMDSLDEETVKEKLAQAAWIVDALFGSGLRGPLRPPFDRVVELINASAAGVLAVDVPSGLDADAGRPLGATIRADHTAVIIAPRVGFDNPEAREWIGQVHVIDIGIPRCLLEQGRGDI